MAHQWAKGKDRALAPAERRRWAVSAEATGPRRSAPLSRCFADPGPGPDPGSGSGAASLVALGIPGAETGRVIAAFAPLLLSGAVLYCIDGGNVFNPYRLAVWMRKRGGDPSAVLERIFISRAYTCHQLVEAVEAMLPPLAEQATAPLVALLGVDLMFHDEDLPLHERRYLYGRMLECARRLGRRGLPILITFGCEAENPWARRLRGVATLWPDVDKALSNIKRGLTDGTHVTDVQHLPGA